MNDSRVVAKDRIALYYPYIHVRNINWLKSTLLCFPQVRRMVPKGYTLRDREEIQAFCEEIGPHGPLLSVEEISPDDGDNQSAVSQARTRLRQRLEAETAELQHKFSRAESMKHFAPDEFQIYTGKLGGLMEYLLETNLAWRSDKRADPEEWLCVHPALGDAIMATIAMALAKSKGLDLVTSEQSVYLSSIEVDEEHIYDRLLGRPVEATVPTSADQVDDLAQLIIHSSFDVKSLTAEKIAKLQNEGSGLQNFKNEVAKVLATLPDIPDPEERKRRLEEKRTDILDAWQKYKESLKWRGLEAVLQTREIKILETTGIFGAGLFSLYAGLGVSVAVALYEGYQVWRSFRESLASLAVPKSSRKSGRKIRCTSEEAHGRVSRHHVEVLWPGFALGPRRSNNC